MSKTNGQIRRSLGEQIDRLDAMLEGLGQGICDAVAQAVREEVGIAVKEAVQGMLREALANPEMFGRPQAAAAPVDVPAGPPGPKKTGSTSCWASIWTAPAHWLQAAGSRCGRLVRQTRGWAANAWAQLAALRPSRCHLLTAAGVCAALGLAVYLAGPSLAPGGGAAWRRAAEAGVQAAKAVKWLWDQGTALFA